ncbi:MAG: 5-(carboxyamino)imidazole ribonucleotide mutase [Phycisphaerae bacterium]|nr:5-(carboxyamino)imidazole ribonucleotide mutase [Phycisphaerae bacterium]
MTDPQPLVGVVMGSDSDLPVMQSCVDILEELGIAWEVRVISAHRTPDVAHAYAAGAKDRGLKVLVAAAGMSAALSGVLAAQTPLPVIGVPMASGPLGGIDAALSTMQMPPGVPVACMAVGKAGAKNAAVYAAAILAVSDADAAQKLAAFRDAQHRKVVEADAAVQQPKH